MRGIVTSLVLLAALWIGLTLLADYACSWLEVASVSPLVIALVASFLAIAISAAAAAMWILSTYLDEDGQSDEDGTPVLRARPTE